ncbi:MAG: ABC transporter ATP-binding protein [Nocardiopsaceae bacterium]|nr:ABC transporter ATP-binding protein [Nocardiopsaceae bacterium]
MAPPLLSVRDLSVRIRSGESIVHAVNDVSLDVEEGEIVGVVGESGCGKSTMVKAVLRLLAPEAEVPSGSAVLAGSGDLLALDHKRLRQVRGAHVGYVSQNPFGALNPIYRLDRQFHNLVAAHRKGTSRGESRRMAAKMLDAVGIAGPDRVLDGYAHQLSGGMAQRVVIAMSFLLDPRLVIADEPTTGLDVTVQRQILDMVAELARADGRAMLLVTHDLGVVAQYCRRVVVMYAGRVVESGPVADVFTSPRHPYTQALLGAVPRPGQPLERLPGAVPDLRVLSEGCAFAPRCRSAFDACSVRPEPTPGGDGRTVACHLEKEPADAAAR